MWSGVFDDYSPRTVIPPTPPYQVLPVVSGAFLTDIVVRLVMRYRCVCYSSFWSQSTSRTPHCFECPVWYVVSFR